MKSLLTSLTFFSLLFFASCGGGGEEAVTATEPETSNETEAVETPAETGTTYMLNKDNSVIMWKGGKKLVESSHNGKIMLSDGSLTLANGTATAGSFTIDMTSMTNEDLAEAPEKQGQLMGHLKSPDFFNVEEHPIASFELTEAKVIEGGTEYTHDITGNLTIKGITKQITFPAKIAPEGDMLKATSNFAIDRTQWDVRYGSDSFFDDLGDKVIKDEIELTLDLAFNQAGA